MEKKLVKIRCPFKVRHRQTGELIPCNRLCVKVMPGSSGEVWCRSCNLKFDFSVDNQMQTKIFVKAEAVG